MLVLIGVPGIYFHSLFGSRGWSEGSRISGHNRTINRQKLDKSTLEVELLKPNSRRYNVFQRYSQLLKARSSSPAFDPYGSQSLVNFGPSVFALVRKARSGSDHSQGVLCLHNVTNRNQLIEMNLILDRGGLNSQSEYIDLVSEKIIKAPDLFRFNLLPYQVLWLREN